MQIAQLPGGAAPRSAGRKRIGCETEDGASLRDTNTPGACLIRVGSAAAGLTENYSETVVLTNGALTAASAPA